MLDAPNSIHVMFNVPFRNTLIDLISSLDIKGASSLSDILEMVTLEEFIIILFSAMVFDEMDIVLIGSITPISASLHCSECPVVLHITSSLSPASHARALGEGDRITATT